MAEQSILGVVESVERTTRIPPPSPVEIVVGGALETASVRLTADKDDLWMNLKRPWAREYLAMIAALQTHKRPVQLTVERREDGSGEITGVKSTHVMRVRHLSRLESGDVAVLLRPSVAPRVLRSNSPRFKELLQALEVAYEHQAQPNNRNAYVVVADGPTAREGLELQDVQPLQATMQPISATCPLVPMPQPLKTESQVRALVTVLPDLAAAKNLFNAMKALACDPANVQGVCTPFAFPEDGCHTRAHQMCERLLVDHNVVAAKVWVHASQQSDSGFLSPETPFDPDCFVNWTYHVAPLVRVKTGSSRVWRVIDPSLYTSATNLPTIHKWKVRQKDPHATHIITEAALFDNPPSGPDSDDWDPNFCFAPASLAEYQASLIQQVVNQQGKLPPYCS